MGNTLRFTVSLIFGFVIGSGVALIQSRAQTPAPPPSPLPTGAPQINPAQIGERPEIFMAPLGMTNIQIMGGSGNPGLYICNGYTNFQTANGPGVGVPLYSELIIPAHAETSGPVGDSIWRCMDGPAGANANEWVLIAQAQ